MTRVQLFFWNMIRAAVIAEAKANLGSTADAQGNVSGTPDAIIDSAIGGI